MKNIFSYIETKSKTYLYDSEEFLKFLDIIKDWWYLTENEYSKIIWELEEWEFQRLLKILLTFEWVSWLEYLPAAWVLFYIFGDDIKNIIPWWEWSFEDLGENSLMYISIIIPIIMLVRGTSMYLLTKNTNIPHKKKLCLFATHPLWTHYTHIAAISLFLSKHQSFLKLFKIYIKNKKQVNRILWQWDIKNTNILEEIMVEGDSIVSVYAEKIKNILSCFNSR